MQKLIFKQSAEGKNYSLESSSDEEIRHLAFFLTDDTGCTGVFSWKNWLNDPTTFSTTSNYSYLEKNKDNVSLWFEYDYFNDIREAVSFETTIDELNYILDRWQEACDKKPKKIIITRDNGKVTVDFEN